MGSGAQGAVFLGKLHGQEVAVKKVRNIKETDIKHLRKLKHPNIITFKLVETPFMRDLCGSVVNTHPSDLSQRYLYPGSVLLHHHGVLCTGAAV